MWMQITFTTKVRNFHFDFYSSTISELYPIFGYLKPFVYRIWWKMRINNTFFLPECFRQLGEPREFGGRTEGSGKTACRFLQAKGRRQSRGGRRRGCYRLLDHLHQLKGALHQVQPRRRRLETIQGIQRPGAWMGWELHGHRVRFAPGGSGGSRQGKKINKLSKLEQILKAVFWSSILNVYPWNYMCQKVIEN